MGGLKARPMDYGAGLQPLILCALKPVALPQAGIAPRLRRWTRGGSAFRRLSVAA